MTHLILHKVRGKPAFDIAEQCDDMGTEEDPGPWWIIPTSGHRAYPYWQAPLSEVSVFDMLIGGMDLSIIPEDWPDHYTNGREPTPTVLLGDILSGLIGKFPRRA